MNGCRPLLGTYVDIRITDAAGGRAEDAIQAAFCTIEQVQALMSLREPYSELSSLNRRAHLSPVTIHPWTREVLQLALDLHEASAGLFDCCVAHRLARWGLLPGFLRIDEREEEGTMADLYWTEDGCIAARRPVCLDFGGIAKGFAVDKAAEVLLAAGVKSGVVNAGGDLRVIGPVEEAIHIRRANAPSQLACLGFLADGAVATSGSYFSSPSANVPNVSALLNPLTGEAVVSEASYTVIAPSCAVADGLTKVLAVTGNADHPCFSRFDARAIIT